MLMRCLERGDCRGISMPSVVQEAAGQLGQASLGLRRVVRVTIRASDIHESDLRSSIGKGGE